MILENHIHFPAVLSLGVIVIVMGAGVLASMWYDRRNGLNGNHSAGE
jgi:hypothetical protein